MFCNIWERFHGHRERSSGAGGAGTGTGASLGNAWISGRLLPGPHCCHAVKMCSRLEFGSLAPDGEGTSPLTEGVGAAALRLQGEVMGSSS